MSWRLLICLIKNKIRYYVDHELQMIYVDVMAQQQARLVLARANIIIEYPQPEAHISQADSQSQISKSANRAPFYTDPVLIKLFGYLMAAFIIAVIIFTVIKPLVNALIYVKMKSPY